MRGSCRADARWPDGCVLGVERAPCVLRGRRRDAFREPVACGAPESEALAATQGRALAVSRGHARIVRRPSFRASSTFRGNFPRLCDVQPYHSTMDSMRITGQVAPAGGRYSCVRQCGSTVVVERGEALPACPVCMERTGWTHDEAHLSEAPEPLSSPRGPLSSRPRQSGVHTVLAGAAKQKHG
jgi:hypothetical protein